MPAPLGLSSPEQGLLTHFSGSEAHPLGLPHFTAAPVSLRPSSGSSLMDRTTLRTQGHHPSASATTKPLSRAFAAVLISRSQTQGLTCDPEHRGSETWRTLLRVTQLIDESD